jgi:hypothetical protein
MAVADAGCQESTGINEAIDDAVIDAASGRINDQASTLVELAALQRKALDSAKKILERAADHGGS